MNHIKSLLLKLFHKCCELHTETYVNRMCTNIRRECCAKIQFDNKVLFIEGFTSGMYSMLFPGLIMAYSLAKNINGKVISLGEKSDSNVESILSAFGFDRIVVNEQISKSKIEKFIESLNDNPIFDLSYDDINIGKFVYDKILRDTNACTIENYNKERDQEIIERIAILIENIIEIMNQNNIEYVLLPESVYDSAILAEFAHKKGINVICYNLLIPHLLKKNDIFDNFMYHETVKKQLCNDIYHFKNVDNKIKVQRWKPTDIGKEDKIAMSEHAFYEVFEVDRTKPIVFIFSHCLTDAPHGQIDMIFKDYYEWLKETIKIIGKIEDINWILKPHPARHWYNGEQDIVKVLCDKYGNDNLKIFPDCYNESIIYEKADCLVTVSGTCGIQYPAKGIPTIICGKPWYRDNGFTIEPKTYEEYLHCLQNIPELLNNEFDFDKALELNQKYDDLLQPDYKDPLSVCFYNAWSNIYKKKGKNNNEMVARNIIRYLKANHGFEENFYYKIALEYIKQE